MNYNQRLQDETELEYQKVERKVILPTSIESIFAYYSRDLRKAIQFNL